MRTAWRWIRISDVDTKLDVLIRRMNDSFRDLSASLAAFVNLIPSASGTAVLVAGTVVVPAPSVTATSQIILTSNTPGGAVGFLGVSARTPGTSFTILSSSATDTSTVAWLIIEPA